MKFEFSAGGIVVRREKGVKILLCQHAQHHGWVFPKGLIGDTHEKESKEETAVREVQEECGVDGKIVKQLASVSYWYQWEGEKRKKTVYYFLMDYLGGDITKHDLEMENVEWLEVDEVAKRLTYSTDKRVWEEAKKLVTRN